MSTEKSNLNLSVLQAIQYLQSFAKAGDHILDVGCGDGTHAKHLMAAGFKVTAIDGNPKAIATAQQNGVKAIHTELLQFQPGMTFDIIFLARSLHHMHPFEESVDHLASLLKEDGLLIVEDFAAEKMTRSSAVWFFGLKSMLAAGGRELNHHGPKLDINQIPSDPLQIWNEHHFKKHHVIESSVMMPILHAKFKVIDEQEIPYLYHYFLEDLSSAEAEALKTWESRLNQEGIIPKIGLRLVARRNTLDTPMI